MSVQTSNVIVDNVPLPVDGSGVTQPVSGTVSVSNFPATQPVSGTVSISGTVSTVSANASTATISQISLTATNQVLLPANANRKKVIIFSAGGKTLVALGSAASATNFTYSLPATNTTLEITGWTGSIQAIQTGGTSTVTTTELV